MRSDKMSVEQYDRERSALRAEYGDPVQASPVKPLADQGLARLFVRSGWSQIEIADREGKTKEWVLHRTRLYKVMAHCEQQGVAPPANLTAVMLRDKYWKGVGRTGPRNEGAQLARVFVMMRGDRDLGWGGEPAALPAPAPDGRSTAAAEELLGLPAEDTRRSLPELYERAKAEVGRLERLDQCKIFADKVLALAAYARRARDPELRAYTQRVVAWATRRAGELLRQIEPLPGVRSDLEPTDGAVSRLSTRKVAATEAGLSERQRNVALRLAMIPPDEFARLVEQPEPATIDELKAAGRAVRTAGLVKRTAAPTVVEQTPTALEVMDEARDAADEPSLPGETSGAEGLATGLAPAPLPKFDPGTTSPTDHGFARSFLWVLAEVAAAIAGLESFDLERIACGLTAAELAAVAADLARVRAILQKIDRALGLTIDA